MGFTSNLVYWASILTKLFYTNVFVYIARDLAPAPASVWHRFVVVFDCIVLPIQLQSTIIVQFDISLVCTTDAHKLC